MSEPIKKPQLLPIAFAALDVEADTKPVPLVNCPRLGDAQTPVALCGRCGHCQHVAFVSTSEVVLACSWPDDSAERGSQGHSGTAGPRLHEIMQAPGLCVTPRMPVHMLLTHLAQAGSDLIPVLDADASPIGIVIVAELLALLATGADIRQCTVAEVMSVELSRVYPDVTAADAALLLGDDTRHLAVISARGRFLGLVSRDSVLAMADSVRAS